MSDNDQADINSLPKVLLLEDDHVTAKIITSILEKQGIQSARAETKPEFIDLLSSYKPHLIIVDNIPGTPSGESYAIVRSRVSALCAPVIAYSGISEEKEIISLLELGIDRVIPKSNSPQILAAEIRALLRMSAGRLRVRKEVVTVGELRLDPRSITAHLGEAPIKLTPSEFQVLYLLASMPDTIIAREDLISFLHGDGYQIGARLIDVFIFRLRKNLGNFGKHLKTVRGVGYRLSVE